ncbi:SET domain-containing protein 9 isoform 1-T1 [Synchiropus picturatus]
MEVVPSQVKKGSEDKLVRDEEVTRSLLKLFSALRSHEEPGTVRSGLQPLCSQTIMMETLGFCIDRRPSLLPHAGTGVFVSRGLVSKGATVAMYPGTVYQAYEPILLQSIRNPFVFRCIDGILIDGNDKGISKMLYKSCSARDRVGPFMMSDTSWLSCDPLNPLAVGQYVNNCSNKWPANVCYQEYDLPEKFPIELRKFIPNINYSQEMQRPIRCVVLVSLRDITAGEELFSNYYTIVH